MNREDHVKLTNREKEHHKQEIEMDKDIFLIFDVKQNFSIVTYLAV